MLYALGFIGLLSALLLTLGWFIGGMTGLEVALLLIVAILLLANVFPEKVMIRIYKAKKYENGEIDKILEKLCFEAQVEKPRVFIIDNRVPNSLIVGRSKSHFTIIITKGIFDLSKDEIEGVLSHQIGHAHRGDMILMSSVAVVAYIISYIGQKAYWAFYLENEGGAEKSFGIFLMTIFAPPAMLITRTFLTNRTEYRADKTGATITHKPMDIASAIQKIEAISKHERIHGPAATSHLWIVNPFREDKLANAFYSHPPIENRMHMLESAANRSTMEREFVEPSIGF
ncbi:MAG: M48 family metalloprotease [Candidatus Aenigmarchaeota archaeon]|nr:M48 family metalloprotease [Candidatus Aenigmarchaeota archaeon]